MGATLSAVSRWLEATPKGVSWLGFLYGGNIAGAVFGCLLAGFFLLRLYDKAVATYAAVGVNLCVALIAWTLSRYTPGSRGPITRPVVRSRKVRPQNICDIGFIVDGTGHS